MDGLKTVFILLLGIWGFVATKALIGSAGYVPPDAVDEMLDERTRVLSAEIRSAEVLADSLRSVSKAMADRIAEQEEELLLVGELRVRLNVYRDSVDVLQEELAHAVQPVIQVVEAGRDTSLVYRQTFTDGLFEVRSEVLFTPSEIRNDLRLTQLREPVMTLAVTEGEGGQLLLYASVPEFDLSGMEVFQPPPAVARKSWIERNWHWMLVGAFGLGAAL